MGRVNKDVGGYRGRRTVTDILKFIAIALGVIVVLVLAGLFFAQRYIVYTDDGIRLNLPPFLQMFRGEESPSGSLPDPGSVVIDPGYVQPDASAPAQRAAEGSWGPGYALELPLEDVLNGTAAARLEEEGAAALILEAKAPSGQLAWYSDLFTADWAEVNAPKANNDALKQWNAGEVYTIARVCCFRDDSVPYSLNKQALRKGNYNWRDELGLRWLSPANEENQAYIAGLCGELGALGFDEIVLEQFHFPVQGNVENISRGDRYDPAVFTARLESLLIQVQSAVEPYGTKISLRVGRDTLSGAESVSGVTPELLERYACRVWVEEDGLTPSPADLLEQAGISDEDEWTPRLVAVVSSRNGDSPDIQAVIPETQ